MKVVQGLVALLVIALALVAYDDIQQRQIAQAPLVRRVCETLLKMPTPSGETTTERMYRVNFTQGLCATAMK